MALALPPRYDVALPHSDIREGRLGEAVFAANIWAVRQNNAPTTYQSPAQIPPLTDAQREDLQRRLAAHEANPKAGSGWEEVQARLRGWS